MTSPYWPIAGLTVRTPRLELRLPTYEELFQLAALAADGIHEPDAMPFSSPWTDVTPAERGRSVVQWHWRVLGDSTPERWNLPLTVFHDGEVIGTQELSASRWALMREGETGSWLGQKWQGRGFGTEMRRAVVHLAFAGLGAEHVTSSAYADNVRSRAVSRRVGYEEDGIVRIPQREAAAVQVRFRITREGWESVRADDVDITGLAPALPYFGLAS